MKAPVRENVDAHARLDDVERIERDGGKHQQQGCMHKSEKDVDEQSQYPEGYDNGCMG
jgi:hypothetical protein